MNNALGYVSSVSQLGGAILLKPKRGLSNLVKPDGSTLPDILAQATIEELGTDVLEVTEHPVSINANISDHAFKVPSEIELKLAWSNSPNTATSYAGTASALVQSSGMSLFDGTGAGQAKAIYDQLLAMQASRALFDVYTAKRKYQNMICTRIMVKNDYMTENALFATLTCREVLLVSIQTTNLNGINMADGQKGRASATNIGSVSAVQK